MNTLQTALDRRGLTVLEASKMGFPYQTIRTPGQSPSQDPRLIAGIQGAISPQAGQSPQPAAGVPKPQAQQAPLRIPPGGSAYAEVGRAASSGRPETGRDTGLPAPYDTKQQHPDSVRSAKQNAKPRTPRAQGQQDTPPETLLRLLEVMTEQERREFERTGQLPAGVERRLRIQERRNR